MPDFQQELETLINTITPEIYANLKQAIELGRWQNGERLSSEQVDFCLQAVIAYDHKNMEFADRVAYIDRNKLKTKKCPE